MITGASSGLGESLAHSFYKSGCRVILAARRQNELQRVRNDLLAMHVVRITCLISNVLGICVCVRHRLIF
jgi:NADP-dependent 3-hydroxy acid dehydrogenase YdfG